MISLTKYDFTNKINTFDIPENSFLVTIDVKALHTSITNNTQQCCQRKIRQQYQGNCRNKYHTKFFLHLSFTNTTTSFSTQSSTYK